MFPHPHLRYYHEPIFQMQRCSCSEGSCPVGGRWMVTSSCLIPSSGSLVLYPSLLVPYPHPIQSCSKRSVSLKNKTVPTLTERADCPILEPPTHPSCLSLVLPSSTSPATSEGAPAKRESSIARCARGRPRFPSKCPTPQRRQPLLSTGVVGASGLKGSSVRQPGGRGLGPGWAPQEAGETWRTTPGPLLKGALAWAAVRPPLHHDTPAVPPAAAPGRAPRHTAGSPDLLLSDAGPEPGDHL